MSPLLRDDTSDEQNSERLSVYPITGYAFFNDEYLKRGKKVHDAALLRAKPHLGPHGHFDGGSVLVQRNGKEILRDSGGPFSYGSSLRHSYFTAACAHNVVLVDRANARYLATLAGYGTTAFGACWAATRSVIDQVIWTRVIISFGKGTYIFVDEVSAESARKFSALFHLGLDVRPFFSGRDRSWLLEVHNDVASLDFTGSSPIDFVSGVGDNVAFPHSWVTPALSKREPGFCIAAEISGINEVLCTTLSFERAAMSRVENGPSCRRIKIDSASWRGYTEIHHRSGKIEVHFKPP